MSNLNHSRILAIISFTSLIVLVVPSAFATNHQEQFPTFYRNMTIFKGDTITVTNPTQPYGTNFQVDGDGFGSGQVSNGSSVSFTFNKIGDFAIFDDLHRNLTGFINVVDPTVTPIIITVPSPIVVQSTSSSGTVVTYSVTAVDAVDGPITPVCTPTSGSTFPVGTTTVTCTASDAAGNSKTATFAVTVNAQQITGPLITTSTDKSSYAFGDTIVVSGVIQSVVPGTPLTIQIFDPNNNLVSVTQVGVSNDGKYINSISITGTAWTTSGMYTLKAQYGPPNVTAQLTFYFSGQSSVTIPSPASNNSWYPGKGLKQGDYFSYNVCWTDWHNCAPLQMNFWVKNETSDGSEWNVVFAVVDGSNVQKGVMTIGKITPDPASFDSNISDYTAVYRSTVSWLDSFATKDSPKTFNVPAWGRTGSVGGQSVGPLDQEEITVGSGTFNAWVIGWHYGVDNKVWVDPNLPFPVKAIVYVDVTTGIPPINYNLELLQYGNSQTEPYFISTSSSLPLIPTQSSSAITAATDKSSYNAGDSVVVSGTVNPISSINPQQPVTVQTYNMYNVLVRIDQAIPSPNGAYSITIPTHGPLWQNTGTYTLKIQYDQPSSASKLTFHFNSGTITPVPTPQTQAEIDIAAGAGGSANAACVTANNCFAPNPLTVAPGTTVTWKNTDTAMHVVCSGKATDDACGKVFEDDSLKPGTTFQFTFADTGTYDYFCSVHPWMTGQVIVGQGGQPTVTPTPGSIILPPILKIVAKEWSQNTISDFDFLQSVQYLVNQGMLVVPHNASGYNSSSLSTIPQWIKNNAAQWTDGSVSDATFASGIEYLFNSKYLPVSVNGIPIPVFNAQNQTIQPVPVIPIPTSIKVSTDKSSYFTGDTVIATILFSGANAGQNIAISFADPTGNTIISRTVTTDNTGSAISQFKIPSYAKEGTYQAVVTASVNSHNFNSSSQFSVQQKAPSVSIVSVQATDQQGNPVSSFSRGSSGYVKVLLYTQSNTPSLVTVNLFDSQLTTLGIGSLKTTLATGQSEIILSFAIQNDATVGTANIYVDTFTDWPSSGGKPLTPESSSTVGIQ
ncbi:exported protein of unknown function [Nitrosotalea devaniterrae]|uniref:HYR domain-containing protein n=1 Tax=Nitrosotalea devaniterrae TaxID=1078905 RepID=A0A128A5S6_9ARCH|nr:exported protein of unknown function [Candidatus Nitrosotalea devanaterra]